MTARKRPARRAAGKNKTGHPKGTKRLPAWRGPDAGQLTQHQRVFLAAYSQAGNITAAAELAGMTRTNHYTWTAASPPYVAAFRVAQEEAVERLETEARRRAMGGSDVLLIFLLKGHRPERYRDNYRVEMAGKLDHKVQSAGEPTDEEIMDRLHRLAERIRARRLALAGPGGTGTTAASAPPLRLSVTEKGCSPPTGDL